MLKYCDDAYEVIHFWNRNDSENSLITSNLNKINAPVKGHLEPTHLKSSPLFTFSTK